MPSSNRDASPRKRFTTIPSTRCRSPGGIRSRVPATWANTPPRSMSATSRMPASKTRAGRRFTKSRAMRFSSTGLPAPSSTITRCLEARRPSAARAASRQGVRSWKQSRASRTPSALPSTTTWAPVWESGLSSTGPMSTWGALRQAAAWRIWARGISRPSAVTPAWLAMFWALKGATSNPASASRRQSPAATRLLPTSEAVPSTAIARAMDPFLQNGFLPGIRPWSSISQPFRRHLINTETRPRDGCVAAGGRVRPQPRSAP